MFSRLPDYFISTTIREDPREHARARILFKFIFICIISAIFFLILVHALGLNYTFWAMVGIEVVLISLLTISKTLNSSKLLFWAFMFTIYTAYFFPIIETGGMNSPVLPQLVIVPMLAFLYGSKPEGIMFTFISLLTFLGFYIASQSGIIIENKVPESYQQVYAYINYLFLFVFVLALTIATENEVARANKMLKDSNTALLSTQKELREKADYALRATAILEKALEKEKKSKEKLKNAQAQLVHTEKMAFIGQLTAGIAHEINNPVNFIKSGIDALIQDIADIRSLRELEQHTFEKIYEGQKSGAIVDNSAVISDSMDAITKRKEEIEFEYLMEEIDNLTKSIQNGVERTAEIVNGLRVYSRLDQGEFKQSDINENIDATLVLLYNKFKNRINVTKEYNEIPLVECIPGKINQVFMNLIDNAIQAIDGEGEIVISTNYDDSSDLVNVSITDSGSGIDRNHAGKIFDPFFTTKDVGEGTGLGLAISKGIVDDHNGDLLFESSPKGTTFQLRLPVKNEKRG